MNEALISAEEEVDEESGGDGGNEDAVVLVSRARGGRCAARSRRGAAGHEPC